MSFLGTFERGESLILSVTWTTDVGVSIDGSTLTLTPPGGGTPLVHSGVETVANSFEAELSLALAGRWKAVWTTTPPGGVNTSWLYVE